MAGTGKTTVSETFCTQLRVEGLLGASFFCSLDDAARRDVRRIIPSLARSLARARPKFAEQLVKTLESDEYPDDPIAMNLEDQYRVLILDPVRQAFDADMPLTLSIDALDECPKDAIKLLLKAILSQSSPPSLKVFLTSRPEDHLEDRFTSYDKHRQLLLHDVEQHIVQADIAVYPRHALLQISDLEGHVQFSLSLSAWNTNSFHLVNRFPMRWRVETAQMPSCEVLFGVWFQRDAKHGIWVIKRSGTLRLQRVPSLYKGH
ncbi:hypothetical protein CC2G_013367 [Coprinopsis cinerea AmutBmut pab1-1]|nr:hypothetical protein CC2G_013367 [Coprinopsis cinerea AmutBmut pab1-1]